MQGNYVIKYKKQRIVLVVVTILQHLDKLIGSGVGRIQCLSSVELSINANANVNADALQLVRPLITVSRSTAVCF